jgi:ribosome-associated protein
MIEVTPLIFIDENELHFDFIRASGPGGQNVNKVATAVQLRFDVLGSKLSAETQVRLVRISGKRMTNDGFLVIDAKQYRTQEKNREDAIARLVALVRKSLERPKPRRKTKPTAGSREKRIGSKKKRGEIKKSRQGGFFE